MLLDENYENAKRILNDFPMLKPVVVTDKTEWNKPYPAGLYDDLTNSIDLIVPNLYDGYTLTHEYGHALSHWYFNRCLDIGKLPSHYYRRAACTKQLMTLEIRFSSVTGCTRKNAPSKYGKTNWSEFGAECIRDYYANGDNCAPVSKRYYELTKKWINVIK